ncbi:MAG: hypothetical protein J7513_06045 [Solirubrobacteraceae bacterium]|nr:hypothetical protein [Solirubrobacteraceae bacterium]
MNHLLRARLLRALVMSVGLLAALILPSVAQADIPIAKFKAGPVAPFNLVSGLPVTSTAPADPTQNDVGCMHVNPAGPALTTGVAGQSTDYCVTFNATPGDAITGEDINNTLVQLPVGSQADIDLASKCTVEQFAREAITPNTCPGTSQVGTALAQLQAPNAPNPAVDRQTLQAPGRIYALTTPDGKAALLGVALISSAPTPLAPSTPVTESKFLITVSQLGDPKVGLQNQTDTLAKVIGGSTPIAIQATSLRFWGSAAAHPHVTNPFAPTAPVTMASNFFRVGSTCVTDQTASLTINPYTDTAGTAGSKPTTATTTYKLTGCDGLAFAPTFSAGLSGETTPGGHPQLDVKIGVPAGGDDLGGTTITLPSGLATDLTRIQTACPQADFQAGRCNAAAVIGSAKATLTGINADVVSGEVIMVKVDGKQLPGIGINFQGRLPLRTFGVSQVDGSGRLQNVFSDLPSLPVRTLDITLAGGTRGILQMDPSGKCTASAYDATVSSQNGKSAAFSTPTTCDAQYVTELTNSTKTRPVLRIGGAAPTGKKVKSVRIGLPKGLKFDGPSLKKSSKVTYAENGFDAGVDRSKIRAVKLGSKAKFTLDGSGSNGYSVLLHTNVVRASSSFAKSTKTVYIEFRVVYSDGTKVTKYVALTRAG